MEQRHITSTPHTDRARCADDEARGPDCLPPAARKAGRLADGLHLDTMDRAKAREAVPLLVKGTLESTREQGVVRRAFPQPGLQLADFNLRPGQLEVDRAERHGRTRLSTTGPVVSQHLTVKTPGKAMTSRIDPTRFLRPCSRQEVSVPG